MTAGTVVLIRHGVTDWNADSRFQGHADIPLNDLGRAQAEAMAAHAARDLRPTRIVSSDLVRARETALALARACELEVAVDARLREIDVGEWEGLTMAEVADQVPGFAEGLDPGDDFRWSATGETANEATARVAEAIRDHAERASGDEVLAVVGHGAVLRNAVVRLMGLDAPLAVMGVLSNCGWAVLRPRTAYWRLAAYNQTAGGGWRPPDFLSLAGVVAVPPEVRGASWEDVKNMAYRERGLGDGHS